MDIHNFIYGDPKLKMICGYPQMICGYNDSQQLDMRISTKSNGYPQFYIGYPYLTYLWISTLELWIYEIQLWISYRHMELWISPS